MFCPVCDQVRMREVERDGVMIDICPSCKGVWLDRGELEKILEGVREIREPFHQWYESDYDDHRERREHGHHAHPHKRRKKRSVLDMFEDLFD